MLSTWNSSVIAAVELPCIRWRTVTRTVCDRRLGECYTYEASECVEREPNPLVPKPPHCPFPLPENIL